MDSIEAVAEVMSHLGKKSVRGEHEETQQERAWLDGIGQPENRQLDLFIFRSMTIAADVGLGGLTDEELEQVVPLMHMRWTFSHLLEGGEIVERWGQDGRYRYVAAVAGAGDRPQDDFRD